MSFQRLLHRLRAVGGGEGQRLVDQEAVAERAERDANYAQWADLLGREQRSSFPEGPDRITMAITHAAGLAATDSGAQAILCCTRSGRTALAMARFRPAARLIGLSPDPTTVRALALSWGITSLQVSTYTTTDDLVWFATERAVTSGLVHTGETVLAVATDGADTATESEAGE